MVQHALSCHRSHAEQLLQHRAADRDRAQSSVGCEELAQQALQDADDEPSSAILLGARCPRPRHQTLAVPQVQQLADGDEQEVAKAGQGAAESKPAYKTAAAVSLQPAAAEAGSSQSSQEHAEPCLQANYHSTFGKLATADQLHSLLQVSSGPAASLHALQA